MLFFLHGLESSPKGYKASVLRENFPSIQVPELPKDPWERHEILLPMVTEKSVLVGSSLGGLSALMLARDVPEMVKAMVLVAPAVGFYDTQYRTPKLMEMVNRLVVPVSIPTTIIAGTQDDVIPMEAIQRLIDRSKPQAIIDLITFQEGHRLNSPGAHEVLLQATRRYFGKQ